MEEISFDLIGTEVIPEGDLKSKVAYGLRVLCGSPEGKRTLASFPDLSYDKADVEDFIALVERNRVSPVHIDELIDDYFFAY